jgi:hypothetical protein
MVGQAAHFVRNGVVTQTAGKALDGYRNTLDYQNLFLSRSVAHPRRTFFFKVWAFLMWLLQCVGLGHAIAPDLSLVWANRYFPPSDTLIHLYGCLAYGRPAESPIVPQWIETVIKSIPIKCGNVWFSVPAELFYMCYGASSNFEPYGAIEAAIRRYYQRTNEYHSLEYTHAVTSAVMAERVSVSSKAMTPALAGRASLKHQSRRRCVGKTITSMAIGGAIAVGASLLLSGTNHRLAERTVRSLSDRVPPLDVPPIAWSSNLINEEIGLINRALMRPLVYVEGKWLEMYHAIRPMYEALGKVKEMSREEFLARDMPTQKRESLIRAYESLDNEPFSKKESRYKAFVKQELLPAKVLNESLFGDPRVIQAPTDRMKAVLGPFMVPASKRVSYVFGVDSNHTYASGLTPLNIGRWMTVVMDTFGAPLFIEVDYVRWDAHLNPEALEIEHMMFASMGISGDARRALSCQRVTKGHSKHGLKYKVNATRKSGDPNTSVGNSLLNIAINASVFDTMFGVGNYKLIVLGDDMLCAVDPKQAYLWNETTYVSFMLSLGLEPEIKVHKDNYAASFCSSYFWPCETGILNTRYVLAQKPGRALSKFGYALGDATKKDEQRLLGVVRSLLPHAEAVPGLREFLKNLICAGDSVRPDKHYNYTDIEKAFSELPGLVVSTWETEEMTRSIYGITPASMDRWAWENRQSFVDFCSACEA